MLLTDKVRAVEAVFHELDEVISAFQSWSNLHCKPGCFKCCLKPDLEASVLEFLPFAYYLYLNGLAYVWLEKLQTNQQEICLVLNAGTEGPGNCSEYAYRGMICRLFGYSARVNKYGAKELITCQVIKTEQKEAYEVTRQGISGGNEVPVINHYYRKLHSIDPDLARDFYPINRAIGKALEAVLHYYAYRT